MPTPNLQDNIKFRHLQCFLAVAQQGSLQKAAAVLSITQPAVSKTLKELEGLLDARLFERGRRGAVLTPAGEAFMRHAGASMSSLREAVASVARTRQHESAVVTLGVLPTVAPWLLPQLLVQLDKAGDPIRVNLRIHTGANPELLSRLRQQELDLVMGRFAEPVHMLGLTFEHLYSDPLVLVVRGAHPLLAQAGQGSSPISRIKDFTLILPLQGTAIRHTADSFLSTRGLAPMLRTTETLSVSVARNYTLTSDAVWLSPRGAVAGELADGLLVALPIDMKGTEELVGLSLRADSVATAAQAQVMAALRKLTVGRGPKDVLR